MVTITHSGNFEKTTDFLKRMSKNEIFATLEKYGQKGVTALQASTPKLTGKTAASWEYSIEKKVGSYSIVWSNTNEVNGVNIAVILQYGHGTGWGGYVQGRDYINPAIQPVFDEIAADVWKEVTK